MSAGPGRFVPTMVADSSRRTVGGLVFLPFDAAHAVDLIVRADEAGVGTVWLEMNAVGLDPFPLLAAGAERTDQIKLGTAIVPAFSRHPVALATQALSLEGLAPGRLRLGIGPGNTARMSTAFGHPGDRTLARLREYVQILRPLLHDGRVSFDGEFYSAEVEIPDPPQTPVLLSALGPRAFALAGELSDGALSWLCPIDYLLDVGVPALAKGAAAVGRPVPPLTAHVAVAIGDSDDLRAAVREDLALYAQVPVFGRMFEQAGLREVVIGDEDKVASELTRILDHGVEELMISLIPDTSNPDQEAALLRVLTKVQSHRR
jgi:F420-dependent oxidoreductase-like protein